MRVVEAPAHQRGDVEQRRVQPPGAEQPPGGLGNEVRVTGRVGVGVVTPTARRRAHQRGGVRGVLPAGGVQAYDVTGDQGDHRRRRPGAGARADPAGRTVTAGTRRRRAGDGGGQQPGGSKQGGDNRTHRHHGGGHASTHGGSRRRRRPAGNRAVTTRDRPAARSTGSMTALTRCRKQCGGTLAHFSHTAPRGAPTAAVRPRHKGSGGWRAPDTPRGRGSHMVNVQGVGVALRYRAP